MKQHLSVWMLCVRSKLYPILLIAAALTAVSLAGFRWLGFGEAPSFGAGEGDRFLSICFLIAMLGGAFFCLWLPSRKSEFGYTLRRLRISERSAFLWDAAANVLCLALLWMTELLVVAYLALSYGESPDYAQGSQGLVMAFYRSEFLHALIPMRETGLWVRNGLYVLCAGLLCACFSVLLRHRQNAVASFVAPMTMLMAAFFPQEIGRETYFFLITTALFTGYAVFRGWRTASNGRRRENDETEPF